MLPQKNKVKNKKDFDGIFRNSKGLKSKFIIFKAKPNKLGYSRFGFVVSKKISKKATTRNKIRRQLSSVIKGELKNMKNSQDVLLIAAPGIEKISFSEIKSTMEDVLKKLDMRDVNQK